MNMNANLNDGDEMIVVQVQSQRAYPPFIAYGNSLYQCRNVASPAGDFDLVGRVTVIPIEVTDKPCEE